MSRQNLYRFMICAAVLFFLIGELSLSRGSDDSYQGPPKDLLANNLSQCDAALEILVKSVEPEKTYQSDEGKGGYVQCLVKGVVTKTFKGSFSTGEALTYRFTSEYDRAPQCPIEVGLKYVVFLKHDVKTGSLWLFAEAAQFKSSSELVRMVERLMVSK